MKRPYLINMLIYDTMLIFALFIYNITLYIKNNLFCIKSKDRPFAVIIRPSLLNYWYLIRRYDDNAPVMHNKMEINKDHFGS